MRKHKHRKGWALLALAALLLSPGAWAAEDPFAQIRDVKLSYAIYLGGLHMMDSTTEFTRNGPVYHIVMRAGTQGMVRALIPWDAELNSTGRMQSDLIQPDEGIIITRWKQEPARIEFHYSNGKEVKTVFDPLPKENKNEVVPEEMRQNSLDPLNGIVQMMASFAYGKGCEQNVPIFDGHRRFDVILKDSGQENLDSSGYSIFNGTAQKCEVQFAMRAGSRKDREGSHFWDSDKNGGTRPPIYIYLAKVKDNLPPLPVRAETDTFFGGVMIHLTKVEGGAAKTASGAP